MARIDGRCRVVRRGDGYLGSARLATDAWLRACVHEPAKAREHACVALHLTTLLALPPRVLSRYAPLLKLSISPA
jgi:hypothetical protein